MVKWNKQSAFSSRTVTKSTKIELIELLCYIVHIFIFIRANLIHIILLYKEIQKFTLQAYTYDEWVPSTYTKCYS